MRISLTFIFLTIFFAACAPAPQNPEKLVLVQKEIATQLQTYRAKRMRECYEVALERANVLADSTILALARAPQDTFLHNNQKPTRPKVQSTLDTTPVRPLINR
jgi:hypothetical protein